MQEDLKYVDCRLLCTHAQVLKGCIHPANGLPIVDTYMYTTEHLYQSKLEIMHCFADSCNVL